MNILVTGCAGFIGMHVCLKLLSLNSKLKIIGIDNLNHYYDYVLKQSRLKKIQNVNKEFTFFKIDLSQKSKIKNLFKKYNFSLVIHLAAQAGVRFSLKKPQRYIDTNIQGFYNIIEASKVNSVDHLIYASSSSIYGNTLEVPFVETQKTDDQASFYGMTKKVNELIAQSYSNLHSMRITGLRFFTVYGPWGRPDMALYQFTKSIFENKPINIYNYGNMVRDFTFIDDVVECVMCLSFLKSKNKTHEIYNIGNERPVKLMEYIRVLENVIGIKAKKNFLELQKGDVLKTHSNSNKLYKTIKFKPSVLLQDGLRKYVDWYKSFYIDGN